MFHDFKRRITAATRRVDAAFAKKPGKYLDSTSLTFPVPANHSRSRVLTQYKLEVKPLKEIATLFRFKKQPIWLLDSEIANMPFVQQTVDQIRGRTVVVESREDRLKTREYLTRFLQRKFPRPPQNVTVIAVGGGILCNVGAFIAERFQTDLILVPTTALAVADGNGGKVRVNQLDASSRVKHAYKSFYEPNAILVDPLFLQALPDEQVRVGLGEIIKHALFQSPALLAYLSSPAFNPFKDRRTLLKVALWTAALKRECLRLDPDEHAAGSRPILRAGHDYSDRLEEKLRFQIPHGSAVAIGIIEQLRESDDKKLAVALKLFKRFTIPTTLSEWTLKMKLKEKEKRP